MKKFIVALMVIFLSACTLGKAVTPRQKVSEFLDKYKNQNTDVISQLDETIKTDITDQKQRDRYKTLMLNQYKNMEYEIKDEIIEDDNAVVEVEITVYDYASALKNSNTYLNEHLDEFKKDSKQTINEVEKATENVKEGVENTAEGVKEGIKDAAEGAKNAADTVKDKVNEAKDNLTTTTDYDESKYMDYKLSEMEKVTDKVKYTIEFTLTKTNGEWQLDALSNSDIEKLHGIYIS